MRRDDQREASVTVDDDPEHEPEAPPGFRERFDAGDPSAADIAYMRKTVEQAQTDDVMDVFHGEMPKLIPWRPQPYQQPPPGDWWAWVFSAGAGAGKTATGAWWLDQHMTGPPCDRRLPGGHKALIAGPTFGDAITTCWAAPAGISAHNRDVRLIGRKDGTHATWPNGADALFAGLHSENDVSLLRARAANACTFWVDEAALANHLALALDLIQQRARGGPRPHGIVTSTPKGSTGWRYLLSLPDVVVTYASSYDNTYLSETHKRRLSRFRGTRLEAQEIHGQLLEEYAGALWKREILERDRITDPEILGLAPAERLDRLGIVRTGTGVDPSTWIPELGGEVPAYEGGAGVETGIVTVGIDGRDPPHVYVFADSSGRLPAEEWGRACAADYHEWRCAWVVPETNAGGGMVLATIRLTDRDVVIYQEHGSSRPGVRATVGKRARAEPVALLADQGRFHLVGWFPALENTLTTWDPAESWSPDRMDALVWAVTALEPWHASGQVTSSIGMLRGARLALR